MKKNDEIDINSLMKKDKVDFGTILVGIAVTIGMCIFMAVALYIIIAVVSFTNDTFGK